MKARRLLAVMNCNDRSFQPCGRNQEDSMIFVGFGLSALYFHFYTYDKKDNLF